MMSNKYMTYDEYTEYFDYCVELIKFNNYIDLYPVIVVRNRYSESLSYGCCNYIAFVGDEDNFPCVNSGDIETAEFIDVARDILGFGKTPTLAMKNLYVKCLKHRKNLIV